MATLALSLAGQVIGGALGGPIGATLGRALGGLAGSAIDAQLFGDRPQTPRTDIRVTGSSEGVAIPRVYGWSRISGNIIWATELEKIRGAGRGSKGFGGGKEDEIAASFALALCEGPVAHIGRIWADGKALETEGLNIRFYDGRASQQPDGFMQARQGAGQVPAYRGMAYLVFERLPVKRFGNRIPNISVEVCRPVGDLERDIRSVCVIPGSTEFGYDPEPRVGILGFGRSAPENTHMSAARSDWDVSIDELTALCPNLKHVALIVAWFGTDLRANHCAIEPRVESKNRNVRGTQWQVAGYSRASANAVSVHDGGPAYGGTPSDNAVRAAIADLKSRGISVTLYPFVMMDVAAGNSRTDPYSQSAGQPAYPWRGRITCNPAPGVAGSPDGTSAAASQIASFMNNGYRDFIRHYAQLANAAGGVDAFVIGSEMRQLTWVRSGPASFPFVDALKTLAGEVRGIVGGATKITYAADWSEYSGLQSEDAPGDKIFHLDPLWADANIDAIGIDNYMPLADWRDGTAHEDAGLGRSIHDLDYLRANIAGGEGYDWFYASDEDRTNGMRTPITDGNHDEPWVYRYKDLVNWWSNAHHNRIGGVRASTPTAWVPLAKPIWMMEFGCGAVDKGPNAPNTFGDPKSSEDRRPPFSSGLPDALVQRQAIRAFQSYWKEGGAQTNPVSPSYGGPMVDPERIYLWSWDARPFPAFPAFGHIWADAANYATGHWLNGRLGAVSTEELLRALAADYGVSVGTIEPATPLIEGLAIETVASLRDISGAISEASGLSIKAEGDAVSWIAPDARKLLVLGRDHLQRGEGPLLSRKRGDASENVGRLALTYIERARDYQQATVSATTPEGGRDEAVQSGLVLDAGAARMAAQTVLQGIAQGTDTLETALPPSLLALEPGDLIAVENEADGPFVLTEMRDGLGRQVGARAYSPVAAAASYTPPDWRGPVVALPPSEPVIAIAHIPDGQGGTLLAAGAYAEPWPGTVSLQEAQTGTELAALVSPAAIGELVAPLEAGPTALWSRGGSLEIELYGGHVASQSEAAVLANANRIAVQNDSGGWEVIGFARADLVAPDRYRLTDLLRGLDGSLSLSANSGNRVMVLDGNVERLPAGSEQIGGSFALHAYAGSRDGEGVPFNIALDPAPALPLAPVHLKAVRDPASGDIALTWIRRSRVGGNVWAYGDVPLDVEPERYRVQIFEGATLRRTLETAEPGFAYGAAEQAVDFGGPAGVFTFAIAQISPVFGIGHEATGDYP